MNVRTNRYNDPALGAAFSNIASIFAPPSAQDLAGYATANAKREEAARLSALWDDPTNPLASSRAALLGIQGYGQTPDGFRYGVDTTAATARRGQDVSAATDLERARIQGQFGLAGQFMTPLAPGQVQPGLPGSVAGAFGVPEMPRVEGLPKPLNESEQKAAERQRLIAGGQFTPDMQLEELLGGQAPVKTLDPAGKPIYSTPGAAARLGLPAYVAEGSPPAPDVQNYRAPDGSAGTAVYTPDQGFVDTQTGRPLPPGSQTFKAATTGAADQALGTNANVTLGQRTVALADYADQRAGQYEKFLATNPGVAGLPGVITGFAQDLQAGIRELAATYGDTGVPLEVVTSLTDRVTQGNSYNPAIREALNRAAELAYIQAQLGDPGGEVNVKEWERLYGQFIGNLGGNAAVAGPLRAFREQAAARRIYGQNLMNGNRTAYPEMPLPGTAPPPPPGMDPQLWEFMTPEERALFQ